jgi:hypothetical protein
MGDGEGTGKRPHQRPTHSDSARLFVSNAPCKLHFFDDNLLKANCSALICKLFLLPCFPLCEITTDLLRPQPDSI